MLSELPDEAHGADGNHDASKCPFCKRKAASAPKAYVVLLDGDQMPISMPASTLLAVSKGDRLIVQGNGRWDEAMNTVQVEATKVYVVR